MWDFSDAFVTFDNPLYFFDGSGPNSGPSPVTPAGSVARYGGRVTLPSKKLGETVVITFDYISKLLAGETLVSAVCTSVVYTGVDSNPSAVITGTPTISGTQVNQLVTGGVLGTIYTIVAKATTSLSQIIELSAYLAVVPDIP
jgi:hypothetical protein